MMVLQEVCGMLWMVSWSDGVDDHFLVDFLACLNNPCILSSLSGSFQYANTRVQ